MSLFIDPTEEEFRHKITSLKTTPGYCFLIDIVNSTELKDQNLIDWVIYTFNTFANIRGNHYMDFNPLKCLGDTMMFYIPERELSGATALTLFAGLWDIVSSKENCLKEVRIGAAYCREAYEITFMKNVPDVYGKDIDLTSRLLSSASCGEIVMNKEFVDRIRSDYEGGKQLKRYEGVKMIEGPVLLNVKGFSAAVNIYKATCRR